jgi:hypothetical protein
MGHVYGREEPNIMIRVVNMNQILLQVGCATFDVMCSM